MNLRKLMLISISIYILIIFTDLNDIVYAKVNSVKNDIKNVNSSLELSNYKVSIEAKEIKPIKDNLSGITYCKETNTLFAITNSPRNIYELTLDGEILRKIELIGFSDTEGISYLYDNLFAIVDEKNQQVYTFPINKDTKKIDIFYLRDVFTLKINTYENFGYEGVSYNKKDDILFIVNEKFPSELIKVKNLITKKNMHISFGDGKTVFNNFMGDFSGIYFDSKSEDLLFLSDESKMIAQIDQNGTQLSFIQLEKGFLGLKKDIPQAEGITMDKDDTLYIVSEPNLFYSFKKEKL
ncbi:SdiA-regulated domain-containing protein [Campylobacterota bacterium DY0563]